MTKTPPAIAVQFAYRAMILSLADQQYLTAEMLAEIVNREADTDRAVRLVVAMEACGMIKRRDAMTYVPELEGAE